jgi:hypothetical protein
LKAFLTGSAGYLENAIARSLLLDRGKSGERYLITGPSPCATFEEFLK